MTYMLVRHARWYGVCVGVVIGSALVIELATEGAKVLAGFLFLGAVVGVWLLVYERCLCADRPVDLFLAMVWALHGAAVMSILAALHLCFGVVVWTLAAVAVLAWFVAASMQRQDMPTRRAAPDAHAD